MDERPQRHRYKLGPEGDAEFLDALLQAELVWAKEQRASLPYDQDELFKPRVTMIGPNYEVARLPLHWNSNESKAEMMARTAYLTRACGGKAIMVASDMRQIRSDHFCRHFGLRQPHGEDGFKEFQKVYRAILRQHGGEMKNLPRHLWTENVMAVIKIAPTDVTDARVEMLQVSYTRGSDNQVMWLSDKDRITGGYMPMMQDWWEIPDDDPLLLTIEKSMVKFLDEILAKRGV